MKRKQTLCFLLTLPLSFSLQAYTVSLQVNNNTNDSVKTVGTYSYEEYGIFHSQSPLPVINTIIAPHGRNIPMDNLRGNLTNYDIQYFDFKDMNNNILAMCLSTYYPIREDAIIRFTLHQLPTTKAKYTCTREIIKEKVPV